MRVMRILVVWVVAVVMIGGVSSGGGVSLLFYQQLLQNLSNIFHDL